MRLLYESLRIAVLCFEEAVYSKGKDACQKQKDMSKNSRHGPGPACLTQFPLRSDLQTAFPKTDMTIYPCVAAIQPGATCKQVCSINIMILLFALSMSSATYWAHTIPFREWKVFRIKYSNEVSNIMKKRTDLCKSGLFSLCRKPAFPRLLFMRMT